MQVLFTKDFEKDIKKIKIKKLAFLVEEAILNVKNANDSSEIRNIKKLKGHNHAYRIRTGDYRIGIYIDGNTVEFSCFLNRREIYRYFP
jgi:mRNA interferase RelE/StbE